MWVVSSIYRYKVLEICYTENSQDRSNFFTVVNHLSEILARGNPTIFYVNPQTVEEDEVDYMNYGQVKATRHWYRPSLYWLLIVVHIEKKTIAIDSHALFGLHWC